MLSKVLEKILKSEFQGQISIIYCLSKYAKIFFFIESDSSIFYYASEYKRYLVNYTIENTNTETHSNSQENNNLFWRF